MKKHLLMGKGIILFLILFLFFCSKKSEHSFNPKPSEFNFFSQEYSLIFVGDIMLGRNVGTWMEKKGWIYPFKETKEILSEADLTIGNLESPISNFGKKINKIYTFRANPKAIEGLKLAGFDILTLANNHISDYGWPALKETIKILKENRIRPLGAGKNKEEALKPVIISLGNLKITFLGFNEIGTNCAKRNSPGTACAKESEIIQMIKKSKENSNLVVINFHWGEEFTNFPTLNQIEFAHNCIDSGADLVMGHHPHILQGIEIYKGKLIAYSLGNFVFDQNDWVAKVSIILKAIFRDDKIVSIEIVPIEELTFPRATNIAQGKTAFKILNRVSFLSSPFKTDILLFCERGFIFPKAW